jgi:hypothetical protein
MASIPLFKKMTSLNNAIFLNGVVTSTKRWSDTHIRSSGGGGYVGSGGGYVSAPQITSDVVQRLEVSIKDSQGKESFEDVGSYGVSFKEGDGIAILKEPVSSHFVYLENTTTGEVYSFKFAPWFGYAFGGLFKGLVAAVFIAVIVFLIGRGLTGTLAQSAPDYSKVATKAEKSACIPGKIYAAPLDWSDSTLTLVSGPCRNGWLADKPIGQQKLGTCRCVDREQDKQSYVNLYQAQARQDAAVQNKQSIQGMMIFILGAAVIAGLISWMVIGRGISKSSREKYEQGRKDYWVDLVSIALAGGLRLRVVNPVLGPLKR